MSSSNPAFSAAQNVKGIQREPDFRQTVILPQSVKPARIVAEQG